MLTSKNLDIESVLKIKNEIIESSKINEKEIKKKFEEEKKELNNKINELKIKIEDFNKKKIIKRKFNSTRRTKK